MIGSDFLVGAWPAAGAVGSQKQRRPSGLGGDGSFAVLLSDMMKAQASSRLTEAVSGGIPMSEGPEPGGAASGALMASVSDGGALDSQLGILLMVMLLNSNALSDSMLLPSLLTAMAVGAGGSAGSPAPAVSKAGVSSAYIGADAVPEEAWIPTSPTVTGDSSNRSPELLQKIIQQFNVETSARYTPYKRGSDTYCNIFVWDVTSALGAEVPHYVDAQTGQPRRYPDTTGARELDANATYDWLSAFGSRYGWIEVSAEKAQEYANRGCPAVTAWKNPTGGPGHVQVVCPSENGAYDALRGVSVSQAGRTNREYTYISSIYGGGDRSKVRYFVHA